MKKLLLTALLIIATVIPGKAKIIYVNATATGLNDGSSWANAYIRFDSLYRTPYNRDTVWVANGVYKPAAGQLGFYLLGSVIVYGGFAGTETALSQRSWSSFQTVLDGDIGVPGVRSDNCWQVLRYNNYGSYSGTCTFRLDGFKVVNGNHSLANGGVGSYGVGGIVIIYGVPATTNITIANCIIANCHGYKGGAINCSGQGTLNVINCRFENDTADIAGGALWVLNNNFTPFNDTSRISISDCIFRNNVAPVGGAIGVPYLKYNSVAFPAPKRLDSTFLDITRCTFRGNIATVAGGAIYDSSLARIRVYNSLFAGNYAPKGSVWFSPPRDTVVRVSLYPHSLTHCTISGNRSTSALSSDYPVSLNGADTVRNCIFWDNVSGSGQQLPNPSLPNAVSTNLVQGATAATLPNALNTYSFPPLFRLPGSPAAAPFPITGVYDYRLSAASEAIDTGLNAALFSNPASLNATDLDGLARLYGPRTDLGAYEKAYCSGSKPSVSPAPPYVLCKPDSVLLTASGGLGYYYWNGSGLSSATYVAKDSGIHTLISATDSGNCRSKITFLVTAYGPPSPVITKTNNTLSVPAVYTSYQWYRGGVLIAGATGASYNPSVNNAVYTVRVTTAAGCTGLSGAYNLTNLAVGGSALISGLVIYPNPAVAGRFSVSFDAAQAVREASITVTDVAGRQVYSKTYLGAGASFFKAVNLSGAAPGIYFVKVAADGAVISRRVVVE